jgi:alpha-1,2-mannosyltransferase
MGQPARRRLALMAIAIAALATAAILVSAGDTLGYDYQAYVRAAHRILDGQPLYDPAVDLAGAFAVYLYPPPFAVAMVPFTLLPDVVGQWLWIGLLIAAFVVGVAAMPVSPDVRWVIFLLGGIDWPVLYGLKLGQVSAFLFVLFVFGWRWLERPVGLGPTSALGAIVKLQPALLLVWAALTARWRAVAIGVGVLVVAALVSTIVVGPGAWADYLSLLGRVSSPVSTPHNFTAGAVAFQLGASESTATALQYGAMAATILVVLASIRFATAEASLLAAIVASQLLSPLLWDHYAIVLLLPAAFLLQRGQWWAAAIPLVTSVLLIGITPAVVYPVAFAVSLAAPAIVARRTGTTGAETLALPVG